MNILIKGKCATNYNAVYEEFINGSETRSKCCDESKTTISKIDNNNFIVLMFDVDMPKMKDLLATPERAEIMKKNGMSNEMFQFSPIA
jgi:hypothetical protein